MQLASTSSRAMSQLMAAAASANAALQCCARPSGLRRASSSIASSRAPCSGRSMARLAMPRTASALPIVSDSRSFDELYPCNSSAAGTRPGASGINRMEGTDVTARESVIERRLTLIGIFTAAAASFSLRIILAPNGREDIVRLRHSAALRSDVDRVQVQLPGLAGYISAQGEPRDRIESVMDSRVDTRHARF